MKLELKKFDPRTLKDDSVVVLIGKRNTGKSMLLKHLLSYHQSLPLGLVTSPTEKCNKFFEKFIPKMLIYDEFDPEVMKRFLDRQAKVSEQYNTELAKYGKSQIDPRALLVLDDCLYDKTWPNDKNIRALFMNGRHFKRMECNSMFQC
jgi:hypothetical protein